MKIAIIGMGNVGNTLGRRWAAGGHNITFGVRDPQRASAQSIAAKIGAQVTTIAHAAVGADVVLLAVPWTAVREVVQAAGDLTGKILLDCTNPRKTDLSGLDTGSARSAGEQIAAWAPGARVVKIFNTTGAGNMADPKYNGKKITMFMAGNDDHAKDTAGHLAAEIGFEAVDVGPLSASWLLESLAMLWITLAYQQAYGPNIALALLKRQKK